MNKPVINFEKYEILNISFKKIEDEDILHDEKINIETNVSIGFTEGLEAGKVEIQVKINDPEMKRIIDVGVSGLFSILEGLNEEQVKVFLAQNGTAIIYPYVRSIVSMVTSLDSGNALLLPTINTVLGNE